MNVTSSQPNQLAASSTDSAVSLRGHLKPRTKLVLPVAFIAAMYADNTVLDREGKWVTPVLASLRGPHQASRAARGRSLMLNHVRQGLLVFL